MATIKSYTDIEQSCKLAEILSLESADIFYNEEPNETYPKDIVDTKYPMVIREGQKHYLKEYGIPCWSLSALLSALPYPQLSKDKFGSGKIGWIVSAYPDNYRYDSCWHDNPVDACVAMIEKLHELNLL